MKIAILDDSTARYKNIIKTLDELDDDIKILTLEIRKTDCYKRNIAWIAEITLRESKLFCFLHVAGSIIL